MPLSSSSLLHATHHDLLPALLAQQCDCVRSMSNLPPDDLHHAALPLADRALDSQIMATRATSLGGLEARLSYLMTLLLNEEVGDYVIEVLAAGLADVRALAAH